MPTDRRLSIIVPTYREAPNLKPLCEQVFTATRAADIDAEMIIVDDNSNDGSTAAVANLAAAGYPVRIIVRSDERGLSSAVIRGFEEARHDVFCVMDADLSHPPDRIPAVADPVFAGAAEFVIGSRYVEGGRMEHWPFRRRLTSWVATLPARLLVPVRDPLAGFFCLPRSIWQRADRLNPIGYKIGLELMVRAHCQRFVEVPITFRDRHAGDSKLDFRQQLLYLRHVAGLCVNRHPLRTILLVIALVLGTILIGVSLV